LRSFAGVGTSHVEELYTQVPELGDVGEKQVSSQGDALSDCFVIVEYKVVMFLCEGREESENVFSIFLTLSSSMRECEGCCCSGLVPGDEPVPC
jgi:hypothetical protein